MQSFLLGYVNDLGEVSRHERPWSENLAGAKRKVRSVKAGTSSIHR